MNHEPAALDHRAAEAQPRPPARPTVNTITSDQLDELYDRLEKLAQTIHAFPDANDAANLAHARAQRDRFIARARHAEAAITRVRAVACDAETYEDASDVIAAVRSALDEPAPVSGPAATQATEAAGCPVDHCDPDYCGMHTRYGCTWRGEQPARTTANNPVVLRDPCPYCEDCPLIPRHAMADHMREHHPEEQQP